LGIERCGKINAVNSDSESWTGIGVVTGCGVVVLILQWSHVRDDDANGKNSIAPYPTIS
jgi:hypothetical protein